MNSSDLQRRRRIFGMVPVAALAGFLGFQAVAFACVPSMQTNLSTTSAEPGDQFQAGATALHSAGAGYVLRLATTAASVPTGLALGGAANSDGNGNIAMVTRTLPTNSTSGVRWLGWVRVGNPGDSSPPRTMTIL